MGEDLLRDLTQYKNYRERSVMMAARSLIGLFRQTMPDMLHKKDRGRPTEASIALEPLKYGEVAAKEFVPGAEVLLRPTDDSLEIDSENSDVRERNIFSLDACMLKMPIVVVFNCWSMDKFCRWLALIDHCELCLAYYFD